jgi:hypothetical protein
VPVSSNLFSFQPPEQKLLEQLKGKTVLDQRDYFKIPDDVRQRYREQRKIFGLLIEPPLKEAYYLRRRLLLEPTGMGFGIHYSFSGNISGAGSIFYDMVTEIVSKQRDKIARAFGVDCILDDSLASPIMVRDAWKCSYAHARYVGTIQEMMHIMESGAFNPDSEALLAGRGSPIEGVQADTIVESPDRIHYKALGLSLLVFRHTFSYGDEIWVDGLPLSREHFAFGALISVEVNAWSGTVTITTEFPMALRLFLLLFYAMLLTVFLTWLLKSLSRHSTKKSA